MKIQGLKDLNENILQAIPEINYQQMIIDDSQLVKFLQELSSEQNLLLFSIIPDFNSQGTKDSAQVTTVAQFLVLKKNYDTIEHDQFVTDLVQAQDAAFKIQEYLIQQSEINCDLRFFSESTWKMSPIWNLAGCNGYSINFSIRHNE